jgi:DNA-binding transcriptional regulator YiaG
MSYQSPIVIPTLAESLKRLRQLPEDIKLIREREGLGLTQMARTMGVSKPCMWYWETGKRTPREPLVILSVMAWADRLRKSTS